ncbi:3-hydroxyisobutyrate dehydrogenase [Xylogone sp. PMI_703]|nr:3-hydroxyisobutyrate dehydrogenase [Xylogone sp. PMI_703]
MSAKPKIGFVGLGAMGFGMATHLVKQGYSVKGYDVFAGSVKRFEDAKGTPASSLLASAEDIQHYVCMVATAAQAQDVLFDKGLVKALPNGTVLYLCSTVPSTYAKAVESQLKDLGREDIFFIDCPVSGGAARAAAGTLSIMAGGSPEALQKGRFLLEEMADKEKLFILEGIGAGSNMKMAHQVLACCHILASSEVMGFAARLGLDVREMYEKMVASDSWSWMYENRTPRMLEQDYVPGVSASTIILKDTGIITSTCRLASIPTPLCSISEQQYIHGLSHGFGPKDDAALVGLYYPDPITSAKDSANTRSTKPADNDPLGAASNSSLSSVDLVLRLHKIIHILACAEAVAVVHGLGVDFDTFFRLSTNAAGASRMLQRYAQSMYEFLTTGKESGDGENISDLVRDMQLILKDAKQVGCPLYLGSQALDLLLLAQGNGFGRTGIASIVALWSKKSA